MAYINMEYLEFEDGSSNNINKIENYNYSIKQLKLLKEYFIKSSDNNITDFIDWLEKEDRSQLLNNDTHKKDGCNCLFCTTYEKFKWAEIMECGCGCHTGDGMCGHDGLCCSIPNGLKKNNPFNVLEKASKYQEILNKMENE